MAHVFPQQQVVERIGTDKVEELAEHLLHQLGVHSMHSEHTQEGVELKQNHHGFLLAN